MTSTTLLTKCSNSTIRKYRHQKLNTSVTKDKVVMSTTQKKIRKESRYGSMSQLGSQPLQLSQ